MKRINICDIPIDVLTMEQTLAIIDNAIINRKSIHHVAINAAKIVNAQTDNLLKQSIINCDLINADGQAIIWAARFLNTPLPQRVTGIDLMISLINLSAAKKYKVFLLGATDEVVKKVVNIYKRQYGDGVIVGYRNGYFSMEEESEIVTQINSSQADILLVALSSPKKEIFLNTYKTVLKVSFIMGVGGSFDVISGLVKRAPLWMQKAGLEWFYRVIQEPRRMWKRYLYGNLSFIFLILNEKRRQIFRPSGL